MAYIIPNGDAVNFDFLISGYAAPGGNNVNFLFIDVLIEDEGAFTQAWSAAVFTEDEGAAFSQAWAVEIFPLFEFTQAWVVAGIVFEDNLLDTTYAVAAPQDLGDLDFDTTWVVDEVPNDTLEHDNFWSVIAVFGPDNLFTHLWAVTNAPAENVPFNLLWFLSPGVAGETVITWPQGVAVQHELLYVLGTPEVVNEVDIVYGILERVAAEVVVDSNMGIVANETILLHRITDDAVQETIINYSLLAEVAEEIILNSEIKTTDTVAVEDIVLYAIMGDTVVQVNVVPTVTIGGQVLPVENADIAFDEGQFAWTCQVVLRDPLHYNLFEANDSFVVTIFGESYSFILDSKEFARSSGVNISAVISGISPSALFASPRATPVTKTWDTAVLARDVADELFNGAVVWEIVNWSIPAFRLAASNQTPIDILKKIAEAAGGTAVSDPDGTIRVRYLYPISVLVYDVSTPDQEYSDVDHNFNVREQFTHFDLVNKLRILDVAVDAFADTVEFEVSDTDPVRGKLKVFPNPWRTDIFMEHTSRNPVSVTKVGVETEQLEEVVEVVYGKGNTAKPIFQVVSLEWLYEDLLGVAFASDSREFTTTHPIKQESLLKITYLTRYVRFDAVGEAETQVQFLVKDVENV